MALFVASALGVLAGSPSQFEAQDGDMIAGNSGGTHDWANVPFFHTPDAAHTGSDDSFAPGQKQDTACPDVEGHQNPPKDDFTDIASYSETNMNPISLQFHHTFLYGATIRYASNGNASENVELKQGTNGSCPNGLLARSVGDKLVAIDYLSGGTSVDFHVLTWIDGNDPSNPTCFVSNDAPPCWGAQVQHPTSVEGRANQSPITAANNPISGTALDVGQFAEFGVDLSAPDVNIIPAGTCRAFPQTVWESRSSGSSFVSTTKDISVENHTISNCGKITIIKHTDPRGLDQDFAYTSNLNEDPDAGGVSGVDAQGNFTLNDAGNTTDDSTANTVSEDDLFAGTYTVTEGADPTGFEFESLTCEGGTTQTSGKTATITLAPEDEVTCTYVNKQQQGAIKITKTSSKGGALAGAKFSIKDPNGDPIAGSPFTTDSNGEVCVDHLAFGTYSVQETAAPDGYAIDDDAAHDVTVDNNATCSGDPYAGESISFSDTPLTDVTVHVASQATGGTKSAVQCVDASSTDVGNSPQPTGVDLADPSTYGDPVTLTANGLKPGTYTCTVVIDP